MRINIERNGKIRLWSEYWKSHLCTYTEPQVDNTTREFKHSPHMDHITLCMKKNDNKQAASMKVYISVSRHSYSSFMTTHYTIGKCHLVLRAILKIHNVDAYVFQFDQSKLVFFQWKIFLLFFHSPIIWIVRIKVDLTSCVIGGACVVATSVSTKIVLSVYFIFLSATQHLVHSHEWKYASNTVWTLNYMRLPVFHFMWIDFLWLTAYACNVMCCRRLVKGKRKK